MRRTRPCQESAADFANCLPPLRAPTLSKTKTVIGAWIQEPDAITPYYTSMNYALWVAQLTLIGLAEWDDKGNLVPELAEVIPSSENGGISPDGLTITWKLKKV